MKVLVVDDQINVVNGILSGVDWESLDIDQVFRAYSAFEAREILRAEPVDILLCDIEMPVEDGLSLYRWVRKEGLPAECVFLTAHADFAYAQEAIRLGSFDYLLQPAPYEEIQAAILKAKNRIRAKQEMRRYSSYGRMLTENKSALLDGILQDCFLGKKSAAHGALESLRRLGYPLSDTQETVCALLQQLGRETGKQGWEESARRYAMNNILTELLGVYGNVPLLTRVGQGLYGVLVCGKDGGAVEEGPVRNSFRLFEKACREELGFRMACYLGKPAPALALPEQALRLNRQMADNVAGLEGVFEPGKEEPGSVESEALEARFRSWEAMLAGPNALPVREEIHGCLDGLVTEKRLNAQVLKLFYQKLIRMLSVAAEQKKIPVQEMLGNPEILDKYLTAYRSVEEMKELVDYLIPYFQTTEPEESGKQIDRILQYIYNHIETDIKRTDIAREVFLNPDYLSRMFKREMGVSLKEFITGEKMKVAKNLLKKTSLPISTIALRVGYGNFSHFSQTYKKTVGVSPEEERKEKPKGAAAK